MKQVIVAKAIIKQGERILLLKRATGTRAFIGQYELPGGKVDVNEDPKSALQREVYEETGCAIETLQLHDTHTIFTKEQPEKQYIVIVFLASISFESNIVLSDEHNKYSWKLMSQIQPNELTDMTKTALGLGNSDILNKYDESNDSEYDVKNTSCDRLIIYCDGGSRGNPGPSASGYVIYDDHEQLLAEGGKYLGITTNNQAEYQAVKFAMQKASELGARHLQFRLDSQLVVNQLTGRYKVTNRDLWPIHAHIKQMIVGFEKVTFTHVRREFNTAADAMVNKILNEQK